MTDRQTRIVYLTAGAGGMFCGSCMHDNALAKSLSNLGFDIQLVPTYTPIRTDETDVSVDQVFFGGINVYLQQKIPPLRWLPEFVDRFLDNPNLIRRVTSQSMDMPPDQLGKLAVSMLQGMQGNQRKEVLRLCRWLKQHARPDILIFSNALIGGCIPEIKKQIGCPVLVTLQGDDVFLDSLTTEYRSRCIKLIKEVCEDVDGFIVHTRFFRDYMSEYFGLATDKMFVTPLGIDIEPFSNATRNTDPASPTIGYLARIAPEKGFHQLVDTFIELKTRQSIPGLRMKIAGWLGKTEERYFNENMERIPASFKSYVDYLGSIERDSKIQFLSSIDVLSVPTVFKEPKGLYALEAMACGVPLVKPDHGAFPEMIEASSSGLLFEAGNTSAHCNSLQRLFQSEDLLTTLSYNARSFVTTERNSESMGKSTSQVVATILANHQN